MQTALPARLPVHRGGGGSDGLGRGLAGSFAAIGLVFPLLALHGWLLWLRISEGRLLEWRVAFRWALGVLLLVTLLALRRMDVPLFWGRKALVLWTLVLLLHWTAPATSVGSRTVGSEATAPILFVLPTSAWPLALAVGLLCASALERRVGASPPVTVPCRPVDVMAVSLAPGFPLQLFARPPPA